MIFGSRISATVRRAETLSQPLFGQPFSCTLAQVPSRQEAMEQFENEMRLMR